MNCNIIKDLMVLYASGECSDESKAAILEHVAQCPGCREIWETMETDVLEKTYEAEKETEFQLVTKEIRKRNWSKIFRRTLACTAVVCLVMFSAGVILMRLDNAGTEDVVTGDIVYWIEDEQWQEGDAVFSHGGQEYISLSPEKGEIGDQLFDGNAKSYFRISSYWEILFEERSRAAFNVQSEWASTWADLTLDNNRVTMYDAGSEADENVYISTRKADVFFPVEAKENVLAYYNDEANYTWTLSERFEAPITDPHPESNTYERENLDPGFTFKDILELKKAFASQETISVKEDYSKLHYVNLHMTSKDGVLGAHMSIEKIDGQWYAIGEEEQSGPNAYYYTSVKLPKSIGDKIDAALAE